MTAIAIREASAAEHPEIGTFYRRCGYSGSLSADDKIFVADRGGSLVGVARLCLEHGEIVLRGMQVLPEVQGQGVGRTLLEETLARANDAICYCIPWADLEMFYGSAGFQRCEPYDVPAFLSDRFSCYVQEGRDVILMRRAPGE
jgi:GNAT superfamily N-acetyltransferase